MQHFDDELQDIHVQSFSSLSDRQDGRITTCGPLQKVNCIQEGFEESKKKKQQAQKLSS